MRKPKILHHFSFSFELFLVTNVNLNINNCYCAIKNEELALSCFTKLFRYTTREVVCWNGRIIFIRQVASLLFFIPAGSADNFHDHLMILIQLHQISGRWRCLCWWAVCESKWMGLQSTTILL